MKKILFFLLLMCSVSTWAQDVIVKRDGSAVVCRIINVSSLEIVYKACTNQQGPNLVMPVADALSVTYENGEKKVFDTPTQETQTNVLTPVPQVQNTMGQQTVSDDVLLKMVKPILDKKQEKAKRLKIAGWVTGGALVAGGAVPAIIGIAWELDNDGVGPFSAGVALIAGGIATTSACLVRAHKITSVYSPLSVQVSPFYQHDFTLKNGTSFSAGVDMLKDNTHHNPTLGVGLTYNF